MTAAARRALPLGIGIGIAVCLAISGCSATDTPNPPPTDAVSTTPTMTPSATPSATPTAPAPTSPPPSGASTPPTAEGLAPGFPVPTCAELLPADELRTVHGDRTALFEVGESTLYLPGPVARNAADSAARSQRCEWGFPNSDGGASALIAELTPAVRDPFLDELRAAGTFTESVTGEVLTFSRLEPNEIAGGGVAYDFDGAAWVAVTGTLVDEGQAVDTAVRIIERLRAAAS